MVLELHVWGPAFGLPSIDPECIAAIAYAKQSLRDGSWVLLNAYDVEKSPNKEFPALRNGPTWVGGFHAIVQYLRKHSASEHDLDDHLSEKERADIVAFSSFLRTNALPLLDLNLFVSTTNYYNATSSAFTALLPWYLNYTIPPARREAARARTQHLGLSALDLDAISDEPEDKFTAEKRAAGIPADRPVEKRASLLFGRKHKGLKAILASPEYAARFKLAALADSCLAPLNDLLGEKELLLRDSPCSLDCLTFGYLALMQYPLLPSPWLADTLLTRFPRLAEYTDRIRFLTIGADCPKVGDLMALNDLRGSPEIISKGRKELGLILPWSPPIPPSVAGTVSNIIENITVRIPGLNRMFKPNSVVLPKGKQPYQHSETLLHSLFALATIVSGALIGGALYVQKHPGPEDIVFVNEVVKMRMEETTLADLGMADFSAGAMLAGLGSQLDFERQIQREVQLERERERGQPLVEARVDVDVQERGGERGETNVP